MHSSSRGDIRFQLSGRRPRSGTAGSCDEAGDVLHSVVTLCGAHRRLVESSLPQGRARCRPAGSHGLPEQRNVCAGTKLEVPTLPGQELSALDKNAASQAQPRNCRFRRSGWGPGVCVCSKPPGALVTCRAALPGTMSSVSPGEGPEAVGRLRPLQQAQGLPAGRGLSSLRTGVQLVEGLGW